jgi:hypothetical protein
LSRALRGRNKVRGVQRHSRRAIVRMAHCVAQKCSRESEFKWGNCSKIGVRVFVASGRNFAACGGGVILTRPEIDVICALSPGDPLALVLRLRFDHAARRARGEDFALATEAMARANVLPRWTRQQTVIDKADLAKMAGTDR